MLEYLFYLFVFLLPWQTVFLLREVFIGGEKWQYGSVGIYATDILIVVILIFSLIDKWRNYNFQFPISNFQSIFNALILNFKKNPYFFLLSSFFFLVFLSILWSPDKIIAFYFSLKLLLAISLLWSVSRIKFDWKKFVFVLALAGALQGILAIGQFLTQQDFDSAILGTSRHEVFAGGTSVIENESGRWLRAYGTFPHPNILGGYLTIVLLIIIWAQNTKYKIQNTLYCFLIFSGLILSFSRAAWLAFAIGLFLIFISQKEKRKELGKIIFIFLLTLLIWTSAFSPLFFSRVSGENRLEQKSISDRAEYVSQAKEIIKNNFWLGAGAGNYTKVVAEKNPQKPIWQIQPVHNVFLLVFAELGIIGFLLFLAIILFIISLLSAKGGPAFGWLSFRQRRTSLWLAFFFLLFFDHWLWTSHFGILFFFLAVWFTIKEHEILILCPSSPKFKQ